MELTIRLSFLVFFIVLIITYFYHYDDYSEEQLRKAQYLDNLYKQNPSLRNFNAEKQILLGNYK